MAVVVEVVERVTGRTNYDCSSCDHSLEVRRSKSLSVPLKDLLLHGLDFFPIHTSLPCTLNFPQLGILLEEECGKEVRGIRV